MLSLIAFEQPAQVCLQRACSIGVWRQHAHLSHKSYSNFTKYLHATSCVHHQQSPALLLPPPPLPLAKTLAAGMCSARIAVHVLQLHHGAASDKQHMFLQCSSKLLLNLCAAGQQPHFGLLSGRQAVPDEPAVCPLQQTAWVVYVSFVHVFMLRLSCQKRQPAT